MAASAVLTRPTDSDTDDRELVAGVRAGDDRAFELLFERYQPRIAAFVRARVHDHGRAEDITQDVFMSALRRLRADTDSDILFKPWIFEIAKNRCIDAYRRSRIASEVSFDAQDAVGGDEHGRLADCGGTPDSAIEGKLAIDNLCGAFGGLSPVHHDILVLRELEGLSYREIGERLGMSRPAVESTLFRARKRLTAEYEELVSGERCLRVQRIVDACGGRSAGLRDQRRMARHLAHCQPCRRYAGRAGVDLGLITRPAAAAARIAAFLPLPAFLRRRWGAEDASPLLHHGGSVGQWSANLAAVVDPGVVSGWTKAVATAATVAVAGMGAGAALTGQAPLGGWAAPDSLFAPAPGAAGSDKGRDAGRAAPAPVRARMRDATGRAAPAAAPHAVQTGLRPAVAADGAGAPRPASNAPGAPAARQPGRPFDSNPLKPPSTGLGGAATGTAGGAAKREADPTLGSVLGAVGAVGSSPGTSAGTPDASTSSDTTAGATPVRDTVETVHDSVKSTVESSVESVSGVTAAASSVSSTVSQAIISTTTTLNDIGG